MTKKDGLIAGKRRPLAVSSLAAVKAARQQRVAQGVVEEPDAQAPLTDEQRAVLRERFERNVATARGGQGLPSSEYFLDKCGSESKPR